jgi:ketosteroid isomerase-like protein
MTGEDLVRGLWELFEARRWDDAGELLTEDFVAEWPHSRERIRGRESFIDLNRSYPEGWHITVDRVVGRGVVVASEVTVSHGEATFRVASFFETREGRIAFERDYWVEEGLEPHPERSRWTEPLD